MNNLAKSLLITILLVLLSITAIALKWHLSTTHATAVRDTSGDKWADIVLGQPDFSEGTRNEKTAYKVNNPGGTLIDRTTTPNTLYVSDSANSRILVYKSLGVCHNDGVTACTTNSDCSSSTCDLDSNKSADSVIGQPDFTRSACNADSGYQSYPDFPAPSASTLCGMPPSQVSPLEGGFFASFAVDSSNRLYYPDWINNRVLMYSDPANGGSGQAASAVWGQSSFTDFQCNQGQSSPAYDTLCFGNNTSGNPAFSIGVDVDSHGNLWVADTLNNRVLRFPYNAISGQPATSADLVLGQPNMTSNSSGSGLDQMQYPAAVRVDSSDNVYIADTSNNRILLFSGSLTSGMSGTDWGSGFNSPTGIEFDVVIAGDPNSGGIWINDTSNHMVELWDSGGTTTKKILYRDEYSSGSSGSGTCSSSVSVCYQDDSRGSIGITSDDDLFVASSSNNQDVARFPAPIPTPQTGVLVPADYQLYGIQSGDYNFTSGKGLLGPYGVAVYDSGATHQLIVSDGGRILYWNDPTSAANGQTADGVVGAADFNTSNPNYGRLQIDKVGHLYAARNNNIEIYQLPLVGNNPSPILSFDAGTILDLEGDSVNLTTGGDLAIGGLYPSSDGNFLWIAHNFSNRVVRVRNPLTTPVIDVILGQQAYNATSCNQGLGSATDSTLCYPGAVVLDSSNNVYVSDDSLENNGNGRLLEYDQSNFPDNNASTIYDTSATNVLIDSDHKVFQPAFDSNNNMVIGFNSYSYSNTNHSLDYYSDILNNQTPAGEFSDYFVMPYSIAFDSSDNMYVTDINRWKILIYKAPFTVASSSVPTSAPASVSQSSNSSGGSQECSFPSPIHNPDLFSIQTSKGSAQLYFTPVAGNVTGYSAIYGLTKNDERFGVIFNAINNNLGVQNFTIYSLNPKVTYYFKVNALNNCAGGPWSSTISAKPSQKTIVSKYKTVKINGVSKVVENIFK